MKNSPYHKEIVESARRWHDNSVLGYRCIAKLLTDVYCKDATVLSGEDIYFTGRSIGESTVRDWINGYTRVFK